ncbi:Guanylate kinase [Verticillium dahliae VDG2]|nr:Guanylate kinase [Verticillium dahliae VDG2]
MSLYHETAEILSAPSTSGGSLRSRIFAKKGLKSPPAQVYALATETCKWSEVLKEVIEKTDLLRHERKLTPILALLLVHDFLLAKSGIALPQTHGLRSAIDRHKARLTSEMTRARLRRKAPTLEALRADINLAADPEGRHPRWVRINAVRTDLETQLSTTFKDFTRVMSIADVAASTMASRSLYLDEHVPNLVAVSPGLDLTKTQAYRDGEIILQDKASCFPAYLLDPRAEDGDVIDSCAAPGNKTTHLAAIIKAHAPAQGAAKQTIFAFERNDKRALTLEKMVKPAASHKMTRIGMGQDFTGVDPKAALYANGSARPSPAAAAAAEGKKRKRQETDETQAKAVLVDDDGNTTELASEQDLQKRLDALSGFQLTLLLHAMKFPAARRITYSTCSVHAEENEHVVVKALQSAVAKQAGWRILPREAQVSGMREWPVRGDVEAAGGDEKVAQACIRAHEGDGRGVMGFFVAAFERVGPLLESDDGPYLRDEDGVIIRDVTGMPVEKATGEVVAFDDPKEDESDDHDYAEESESGSSDALEDDGEEEWGGFD